MRSFLSLLTTSMGIWLALLACVSPEDITLRGTVNVVVVDGSVTNLAERMVIRLNQSKADSVTGRFGTLPLSKAQVEVIIDSLEVVACHETQPGTYQLPSDFKGQVGHAYQLRFQLANGARYLSSQQVMPAVPPIGQITAQFNPTAISPPFFDNIYRAGHDLFLEFTDPADQTNYYRWDWIEYEPQDWCRSCYEGIYIEHSLIPILPYNYPYYYTSSTQPFEDCFYPPPGTPARINLINHRYDYPCRTQCWEILYSYGINVFSDRYTNGGLITHRSVAHIPFYQARPCLVQIRQASLTKEAYQYYDAFQQQTQKTGGLADTPPSALGGNVHNLANQREVVVGYFTASAVSARHYYLDRKDTGQTDYPGLFYALTGRRYPTTEGITDQNYILNTPRPPTAECAPADQRTPIKPMGWPN